MDRHVLADDVARADHHAARMFGDMDVLGKSAEDGAFKHAVVRAEGRPLLDGHAALQNAARTDDRSRLDDAEGTDLGIGCDLGRRTDDCRWVNAHGRHLMEGLNWEKQALRCCEAC